MAIPKYKWRGFLDEVGYADRGVHYQNTKWKFELLFMHKYTHIRFIYNKNFKTFRVYREWGGWYFSDMSVNARGEVKGQVRKELWPL